MSAYEVTIITPTTGKPSLEALIASIERQAESPKAFHILLWDQVRDTERPPESYSGANRLSLVLPAGLGRQGRAPGSALRAIGLMVANTPWVTFADDDVRWDDGHLSAIMSAARTFRWATTLRTVWSPAGERLGVDRFESVGDDPARRVPYEMCDNNCMLFRRELGVAAAPLYRETHNYNDDRLMYGFLKERAGPRGQTTCATVHQTCPSRLVEFFRRGCSPQ